MNDVDWGPALSVLAAGLALGGIVLWRVVLGKGPAPAAAAPVAPLERRDLEGKYAALLTQLRELDAETDRRGEAQLARERHALEHAAARALLEIDRLAKAAPARAAAAPTARPSAAGAAPAPPPAGSALRGFLWGVGSVGAFGLLLFLVSQQSRERAPGGSVTGDTGLASAPADDAELRAARAAVESRPDDIEARLELTRLHLMRQDLMAVFNETQAVLQRSPGHPRALSYQALVRLAMGQGELAESMLREALAKDPQLFDGYIHLMLVYSRTGKEAEADKVLAEASARFPDRVESLKRLMAEMRLRAGPDAPAAAGAADPHAEVAVGAKGGAGAPAPPPQAAPGAGQKSVAGRLELDASLAGRSFAGSVVFVTLREGGFGAGPPLAAKRLVAGAFPMPFEIGSLDSMTGEALPDDLLIEARIDSDGDPTTRPPSDPYGRADRVAAGTKDVKVILRPRPSP